MLWGGRVVRRCRVSYVTRASNLILAYSWTRPAILVAGKGRGGMFLFLLFLHYHSCSSSFPVPLFHLLYYLFYIFSPFLWETTQMTHKGWRVVKPQHNQSRGKCLTVRKQWRPWSDTLFCDIWSGSALFANYPFMGLQTAMG